jgi:outer membrane protein TolC
VAESPALAPAPAVAAPAAPHVLTLCEAVHVALDRQPALAASRASLTAAETQVEGLEKLRIPAFISRQLPIRREQASLGVTIASAGLQQAEWDTIYSVCRNYFSVLYALEEKRVADDLVKILGIYHQIVKDQVDKGARREWTTTTVAKTLLYLRQAEARQVEAVEGRNRALAALREAMGVAPDVCFTLADDRLPNPTLEPCREELISLALARRGELVQAVHLAQVFDLEISAQAVICMPTAPTFASGSDIHARPVPQSFHNGEYRPGAVAPEMPPQFAGTKAARVERAREYSCRAEAVVDKTRQLIVLQAEDAYWRWRESSQKVARTREAAAAGIEMSKKNQEQFSALVGKKETISIENFLTDEVIAARARAAYVEALYHQALILADLERITAGGFCPGFASLGVGNGSPGTGPGNQKDTAP